MGLRSLSAKLLACHSRPLWGQTSLSSLVTLDSPLAWYVDLVEVVCMAKHLFHWPDLSCLHAPNPLPLVLQDVEVKGSGLTHYPRKLHVPPAQEPEHLVCVALHLLLGSKLTLVKGPWVLGQGCQVQEGLPK